MQHPPSNIAKVLLPLAKQTGRWETVSFEHLTMMPRAECSENAVILARLGLRRLRIDSSRVLDCFLQEKPLVPAYFFGRL